VLLPTRRRELVGVYRRAVDLCRLALDIATAAGADHDPLARRRLLAALVQRLERKLTIDARRSTRKMTSPCVPVFPELRELEASASYCNGGLITPVVVRSPAGNGMCGPGAVVRAASSTSG